MNVWLVLDLETDPTPGEPGYFRALATRLRREAEHAEQHTSRLRQVTANSADLHMRGDYAARFHKALADLPDRSAPLGPAHQACAGALARYADQLQQAKIQSAAALERGRQADAQYKAALQQFYALVPVTPPATGVWRGLNRSSALAYAQYQQPQVREIAARIGAYAGQAEQERQLAAQLARQAARALHEAEAQCARTIRAAAPRGMTQSGGAKARASGAVGHLKQATARSSPHAAGAGNSAHSARTAVSDPRINGRPLHSRTVCGDPVDVATGHVTFTQTDVELPGSLPLVFNRTHDSGYRAGRWMGPSWSCTADERLEIDAEGVVLVGADGVLLAYPHPAPGASVLPVTGDRRALAIDADGAYTVTDPDTGVVSTFFAEPDAPSLARLTEVRDRAGRWIAYDHDETGAPTAVRHSSGRRVRIDVTGGRITALHLAGTGPGGGDQELMRFSYTDGHLTEVVNCSGLPLRFGYDDEGRMLWWTDRNGSHYAYRYDDLHRCLAQGGAEGHLAYRYDYDGRDPETGQRITTVTDSHGHTTRFTVNAARQIVAETDPLGHTTRYVRDRYDRLLSHTDPLDRTTTLTYDDDGNLTSVTRPDGTRTLAAPGPFGLPTTITGPDGAMWRQTYDEHGNPTDFTDPTGATTHCTYDKHGHLAAVTDALGHTTRIRCDTAGLPLQITDPLGATTRIERDAFGRPIGVTDALGAVTRLTWTVEGGPATRTHPDGTTETWTYDGEGNRLTHTDQIGGVTRYEYTHFDLLAARTDPDGARYTFTHDAQLQLTTVTNPQGLTWRYAYDPAGRLQSETDFDHRTTTYTHDPTGQLATRTTSLGEIIRHEHDAAGRTVLLDAAGAITRYVYDPAGRLIRAANDDTTLTCRYDPAGRLTEETVDDRTMTYTYDPLGRRTSRTTPSGARTTYAYDAAGNRTRLTSSGHEFTFTHDALGQECTRHLGDLFFTHNYDALGRLTDQQLAARGSRLVHRSYTYRDDGYPTGIDDPVTGFSPRIGLDPIGRPTRVTAADWTETYAYDTAGNQTHATLPVDFPQDAVGPRSYTGTRITRAGNVWYTSDAAGRTTLRQKKHPSGAAETWHYTWNAEDRLTMVTTPDHVHWRYRYDPLGRRIAKQRLCTDGETVREETLFAWDGTTLAEQTTLSGETWKPVTLTWDHVGLHPLAQAERTTAVDTRHDETSHRFYAIMTDLVGTPTHLVDGSGHISWRTRASLWGNTSHSSESATESPFRFPGQYFDPESSLHYNLHRYYDPEAGRYISADPLGLATAPNPMEYVNNPHISTDPLGLMSCTSRIRQTIGAARNWANNTYLGRRLMKRPMEPWLSNRRLYRSLKGARPEPNATVRDLLDLAYGNPPISYKEANANSRSSQILMESVFAPRDGQYIATYAGRPGKIGQGNHRAMQLISRAEDPDDELIQWSTLIFIHRVGE
ncbi:DUF6531 domain-containing protein [Streptomyces sp. NPDC003247]|uniref:DUF6531 domain-containing protein n=1 Tax=Streptomyces sp. NPDC003247 TaxID=3364677 RepID=UPI0036A199FA